MKHFIHMSVNPSLNLYVESYMGYFSTLLIYVTLKNKGVVAFTFQFKELSRKGCIFNLHVINM